MTDIMRLYRQARAGTLPADFDQWALADADGWTVAHEAARFGSLPADFDQWALADGYTGRTVAHVAVRWGRLPPDFDQWELADASGWTVAHVAQMAALRR